MSATRPLAVLRRSIEQAHVAIGIRSLARNDPDREALEVLNHVLGGGMSSRLLQTIREDRGLAYAVYSAHTEFCDAGALTIYAATSPGRVDSVLDLVDEELDRLLVDGITADELDVALGYLEGSLVLGLEDSGSRMSRLGGSLTVRGHVRTLDEQLGRYHAVTLEDVRRVARTVLTEPRSLAVVGPMPSVRSASASPGRHSPAWRSRANNRPPMAGFSRRFGGVPAEGRVRRWSSSCPCSDPAGCACRACRSAAAAARPRSRSTSAP